MDHPLHVFAAASCLLFGSSLLQCTSEPSSEDRGDGEERASGGAGGGLPTGGDGGSQTGGGSGADGGSHTGGTPSSGGADGSGGDEGAGGGPGNGSGGTKGASANCDNSNWNFCDDFESYAVGETPDEDWYEYNDQYGNPFISTSEERSFSGTRSVHFRVAGSGGRAFLNTDAPFPVPGNVFYGRMMIFMENIPGSAHWDIISAYGGDSVCEGNYRWGGQNGHTLANYHPGDCYQHYNSLVPDEGKWLCYEWKFDGPANEMQVWIDDLEMSDSNHATLSGFGQGCANAGNCPSNPHPGEEWVAPEWSHLSLGWAHYQSEDQVPNIWIDDVVIDDARIGCPSLP